MRAAFARAVGILAAILLVGAFVAGAIAHSDAPAEAMTVAGQADVAAAPANLEPVLAGGCMLLVLCCAVGLAVRRLSTRRVPSPSPTPTAAPLDRARRGARRVLPPPSLLLLSISRT